jgi:predicted amidophosphoribosyltransferase
MPSQQSHPWFRLREAAREALSVVAPAECCGCGRSDRSVCPDCLGELRGQATCRVLAGGVESLPAWSVLEYAGVAREVLLAFKEDGRVDATSALAAPLRAALASALSDAPFGEVVNLAVIPSSRAASRRRGYHPTGLLLASAGFRASRVLHSVRQTEDQAALGFADRAWNREGSLRAAHRAAGRTYLIVDDILTTGATVREAWRALEEAGGRVIAAATIASTRRRTDAASDDRGPPEVCGDFSAARVYGG